MKAKKLRSFRVEEALLDQAQEKGLNVNEIVNAAIAAAVKDKRCPFCKSQIRSRKGPAKRVKPYINV